MLAIIRKLNVHCRFICYKSHKCQYRWVGRGEREDEDINTLISQDRVVLDRMPDKDNVLQIIK